MTELLTAKELCGLLRCSLPTVKRLLKRGEFPIVRIGKRVLVRQEAVEAWIQAHETPAQRHTAAGLPDPPAPNRLAQALVVARSPQGSLPLDADEDHA